MSDAPRMTVIVTAEQSADGLARTLDSVLSQGYPDLELLLADGVNTEASREVVDAYRERLDWCVSDRFNGRPALINKALDKATGDLITVLPAGVLSGDGALQTVADTVAAKPQASFVYGACRLVDAAGQETGTHRADIFALEDLLDLWNVWWTPRRFLGPECWWSRRLFLKVRSFEPEFPLACEFEYFTRLFQAGARVERLATVLAVVPEPPVSQPIAESEITPRAREELKIVRRILWNPDAPVEPEMRRRLKADWLYNVRFVRAVDAAARSEDPRWKQWLRAAQPLLRYPQILCSEQFRAGWRSSWDRLRGQETPDEEPPQDDA